jgi:hypothetical protein
MEMTDPPTAEPTEMTAQTGMHVIIELLDDTGAREVLEFDIVPDSAADFAHGFLGEGTPMAMAVTGKPAGSCIPYRQADIISLHILVVSPARSAPLEDAAERREAVMRKAMADVERTNAVIFASSFSGKWGDYDPSGMEHWQDEDE